MKLLGDGFKLKRNEAGSSCKRTGLQNTYQTILQLQKFTWAQDDTDSDGRTMEDTKLTSHERKENLHL